MKIKFFEKMYGSYWEPKGKGRHGRFNFSCAVEVPSLADFALNQTARIKGTVMLEKVACNSEMSGTLIIDPVIRKELIYNFSFQGEDSSQYQFFGKKNIRFLDPIASMTTLNGKISKEGRHFADAELRFHLLELPAFLLSFRIVL